ncbi:hypothetical protein JMJ35_002133 [Cladonia borealis]|uniref:Helicase C-terminal domain-containing protein n=1 Tax=Cladonia borealis TaxID=184061 RepID=A0AA39R9I7_9LECA|nr:hypothetical protein JMJ35_002133 [Cladonia borealis]
MRFQKNFPYLEGKVKHWFGSPAQGRGRRYSSRAKVLDTNRGSVIEYVLGSPDEPATATHIVMTTYQTMRPSEEVQDLDDNVADNKFIPKTLKTFYKSPLAHVFGHTVCDKAHYMKNASSRTLHAIKVLKIRSLAFLSEQQVEAFLATLGFRVLAIRSSHTLQDRERTRRDFNDLTHASEVLVTSIRVSSSSVNLHHGCSDVVFVDVPPNCSEMQQAIGRVYCLGQEHAVHAYLLTLDHTYDQVLQARSARKTAWANWRPKPYDARTNAAVKSSSRVK